MIDEEGKKWLDRWEEEGIMKRESSEDMKRKRPLANI